MKETIYELLGEWRIWLLIIALVMSIISLSPNPWASGIVVKSVDEDSPLRGKVKQGVKMNSILLAEGQKVTISKPSDLIEYGNYTGTIKLYTSDGPKVAALEGQGFGITVEKAKRIDLEFGMDLKGGTRILLQPQFKNETYNASQKNRIIGQTIAALKTRLNVFGLKEMSFQRMSGTSGRKFIQIEAAGAGREVVNELLSRRGEFEAFIPRRVDFDNKTQAILHVGSKNFTFQRKGNQTFYSNKSLKVNDTLQFNNISFEVWNLSANKAILAAKIFSSKDIKYVYTTGQGTYIRKPPEQDFYEFSFKILISGKGAQRFATVTQNLEEIRESLPGNRNRRTCHLSQQIHLFLDEKPVTSLDINCGLKGQDVREPVITGAEKSREKALEERRRLQSILKSGRLPVELTTQKVDVISPRLGRELMQSVSIAGIGALFAVAILIFTRYRTKKIIVPVLLTSFCEVLIILGAASLINWTIDLAAIAGIIAAIGSSVDDQIVITSETLRGEEKEKSKYSVKRRIKRAFFIVFVAAATTIVAMTTLAYIGIGIMRGFAITTIIGVLAGVLITRPAYGKILEKIL